MEAIVISEAYTHSTWRVKPGLEDEFVRRWEELAYWSALQGLTSQAKLLRDVDDPNRFRQLRPLGEHGGTPLAGSVRVPRACRAAAEGSLTSPSHGRSRSCPSAEIAGGTLAAVIAATGNCSHLSPTAGGVSRVQSGASAARRSTGRTPPKSDPRQAAA